MCNLHHKYWPIGVYGESGSSRRLWISCDVFYSGKLCISMLGKDVSSYSTCSRCDLSMGTLVWKEGPRSFGFLLYLARKHTSDRYEISDCTPIRIGSDNTQNLCITKITDKSQLMNIGSCSILYNPCSHSTKSEPILSQYYQIILAQDSFRLRTVTAGIVQNTA